MRLYQDAVRPLLFQFDPEGVHHATTMACQVAGASNIAKSFKESSRFCSNE